ncbi:MAG TPA: adenylate/guanylate cyclase domain-containing protein [Gaiellales bacterium]|nr:adenylate/guanylate cyclase domain-containing protein [Gaiellales bacterium]
MFADLAGSTELAGEMDAEELRDLLGDVYVTLSRSAETYGGTVEKFIGDAVMAVFGVPTAHEDDAERAVRAALLMRSRLAAVAERRGVPLLLRIGVNTGLVVTGTTPGRDFLVTGESVNLAARLQQAAEPGEVLIGERTFRAVEPLVNMVAPRSLAVRGRTGPVTAYAVERFAPAGAYRRRRRPYGPFVGREVELTLIRSVVERAIEHARVHLITLIGEAGIGKSRLVEEVIVELRRSEEPPAVWVGRCLPYGEGGPYAPLRDLLLRAAAVRADATRDEARARVTGQLQAVLPEGSDDQIEEVLRFVGGGAAPPPEDEEHEPGDRGRDAWRELLVRMAVRQPTLLVVEDAHWAEPALLELIASLVAGEVRAPLVVVCVARGDLLVAHPGWGSGARNETTVTLEALEAGDMRRLAVALASDAPPDAVVEMAGGNPFFLEEILAMSGEGGGDRVPETVQGVIAARIDLLEPETKRVLQMASVIGRSFTVDQLASLVADTDAAATPARTLRKLVERDLVHVHGGGHHAFKHVLIRDVAYESIPRAERARLHLRFAEELERTDAGTQAVAGHYAAAAGLGEDAARPHAVRVLMEAGRQARTVGAHGLALRDAELARQLAATDRERCLAEEAVGDAHWMGERLDDALVAYEAALDLAPAAGLDDRETGRLRWKWVDLPTRWGGMMSSPPERSRVREQVQTGLAEARAAGDETLEARLLIAHVLLVWREERAWPPQEEALAVAERAVAIAERLGRPAIESAARDARSALLQALHRFDEARESDERRLQLVKSIRSREEQMDACGSAARIRTATGDYAAAVAAADLAEELAAGGDPRWLAFPVQTRVEAYFWWDRWDDALAARDRYLTVFRSGPGRRRTMTGMVAGVAAAVQLLRGDPEEADAIERRLGRRAGLFDLMAAHAHLGIGDPLQALERIQGVQVHRALVAAVRAEALAALGRWDDLDVALALLAEMPNLDQLPRVAAQADRARGIAGDELALARATDAFARLGCAFEHARCLELQGDVAAAQAVYQRLGAEPALERAVR